MKVEDGKIIEITEDELFRLYLDRGLDDCYSFPEYERAMENLGCKVTNKDE